MKPKALKPPRQHERSWGEGTVKEVRPGVWRAWRARSGTSRASKTFDGDQAAERAKTWARGAIEPAVLLLGHWLDRWLSLRIPRLRPMSVYNYRRHINACGDLALRPLADVTIDELQARANALLAVYSRSDVVNWRACISSALKAAAERRLRADNPMASVQLPKADERPVKAWSAAEVGRLVEAARGSNHETWLWLAIGTGIRLGEARALGRSDVDSVSRILTISKSLDEHTDQIGPTKTGRSRLVNIPDEVMPVLVEHLARLPASEPLLFRSPYRKGAYRARTYQDWIKRLCERASVTPLSCHAARHTFATLALDSNVALKEVSEDLGHADVAITAKIYSHAVEKHRRRGSANAVGAILAGSSPTQIRAVGTQNGTRRQG